MENERNNDELKNEKELREKTKKNLRQLQIENELLKEGVKTLLNNPTLLEILLKQQRG